MKKYIKPATRALELRMERMIASSGGDKFSISDEGTDADALTNRKDGGWSGCPWAAGDDGAY